MRTKTSRFAWAGLLVGSILLASCVQPISQAKAPAVKSSGAVSTSLDHLTISDDAKAKLQALVPRALDKAKSILGVSGARDLEDGTQLTTDQSDQLVQMTKDLLEETFGPDGDQYLVIHSATPVESSVQSGDLSSQVDNSVLLANDLPVVDASSDSVSKDLERPKFLMYSGVEILYRNIYYLTWNVDFVQTFWGSWTASKVWLLNMNDDPIPVIYVAAVESDEITPKRVAWAKASDPYDYHTYVYGYEEISGNLKWGWFPMVHGVHTEQYMVSGIIGAGVFGNAGGNVPWQWGTVVGNGWSLKLDWKY